MGLAYEQPVTVLTSFPEKTFVKLSLGYLNIAQVVSLTYRGSADFPSLTIFTSGRPDAAFLLHSAADIAIVLKALDARCQD